MSVFFAPNSDPANPNRDFVLDAPASTSCPVSIQNWFDPECPALELSFTGHLLNASDPCPTAPVAELGFSPRSSIVDLRKSLHKPIAAIAEETLAAMKAGTQIILSPVLPIDWDEHRVGRPHLLVRGPSATSGRPGYVPVIYRDHRILEARHVDHPDAQRFSYLDAPSPTDSFVNTDWGFKWSRERDALQLAHYWQILQSTGWASATRPLGGVISSEIYPDVSNRQVITWVRLWRKFLWTFSVKTPEKFRSHSPTHRYRHEWDFRMKIIDVVRNDHRRMVSPIVIPECSACLWWDYCRPTLDPGDLSLVIDKARLDVREITTLRSLGIHSIDDLAIADLDDLEAQYLPLVEHRPGGRERLRLAKRRAEMLHRGVSIEKVTDTEINLPIHEVEIDLDIESSASGKVYLWGFLIRDRAGGHEPEYVSFVDFDVESKTDEVALASRAMSWLTTHFANRDVMIYHYSDYELVNLRRLAQLTGPQSALGRGLELTHSHSCDLFGIVRENFFSAHGLGLKYVAQTLAGFEWRDPDPGGLNSQHWLTALLGAGSEPEREDWGRRILEYNEDDTRATAALRDWLRAHSTI